MLFSLSNPVTWNFAPLFNKNSPSFQCCRSMLKILTFKNCFVKCKFFCTIIHNNMRFFAIAQNDYEG